MPDLNIPEPDPRDLDGTQPGKPISIPAPIPQERSKLPNRQPQAQRRRQAPPREKAKTKRDTKETPRRARSRRDSGLYLPVWSLALMLVFVIGISFTIVLLVLGLGGQAMPGGEPQVIIITAVPSSTPPIPQFEPTLPAATLPGISGEVPQFPLEGPTLPPVAISPTPIPVTIGTQVQTNGEDVRVRPQPSLDNQELFFAQPGEVFEIVEGPQSGSGLSWWKVRDVSDPSREGWIAGNLVEPVPPG
ncbi:MAG: SH3 domain-containing protein [Anaerolineae bacterium]|nr:SH3 domain-containing protein [Anaerolineae bacterium]